MKLSQLSLQMPREMFHLKLIHTHEIPVELKNCLKHRFPWANENKLLFQFRFHEFLERFM